MGLTIRNGRVLLPHGCFVKAAVAIEDGYIASVGDDGRSQGCEFIDASGMYVLPGIVDIHGDAFERQLMPRPGVAFSHDLALIETDRQLLANGITTAFHGLTWSFEPGLRGREATLRFMNEIEEVRPLLGCDTRVHLRFENYNLDAVDEVVSWLESGRVGLLAFNDHMDLMTRKLDSYEKMSGYLHRTGLTREGFVEMLDNVRERADQVPDAIDRLAAAARKAGIPMASHDDSSPAVRAWYHERGSRLSEFPLDLATAGAAREGGGAIILGAPNALRGKSHDKRLMARDAIRAGLCDVLTSDYFYPALLHAPFVLDRESIMELGQAWQLVSGNPAKAVGLNDRGNIKPGKRADLVLVGVSTNGLPFVRMTLVEGEPVLSAGLVVNCQPCFA